MTILSCQQSYILPLEAATTFDKAAKVRTRIGNDFVNLFNIVAFEANIFLPIPLCAMRQNSVTVRGRCGSGPGFNDIRLYLFWDRGRDDIVGRIAGNGGAGVVWQAQFFDGIGFKPLLDPFWGETGELSQTALILCQFREDLDPALCQFAFLNPQISTCERFASGFDKILKGTLFRGISANACVQNGAGVQQFVKRCCFSAYACKFGVLGQN